MQVKPAILESWIKHAPSPPDMARVGTATKDGYQAVHRGAGGPQRRSSAAVGKASAEGSLSPRARRDTAEPSPVWSDGAMEAVESAAGDTWGRCAPSNHLLALDFFPRRREVSSRSCACLLFTRNGLLLHRPVEVLIGPTVPSTSASPAVSSPASPQSRFPAVSGASPREVRR